MANWRTSRTAYRNGTPPARVLPSPAISLDSRDQYQNWIALNEPDDAAMSAMAARQRDWPIRPKVSVVVPVFDPTPAHLIDALESVRDQLYDNWELCIADGGSSDPAVRRLLGEAVAADSRVKVAYLTENGGIAANTNAALSLAAGEFVAFLDHDDRLAPFALFAVVQAINDKPELDFVYSDEDTRLMR